MYVTYLDESGTTEAGDNSRQFVLLGLAIPSSAWKRLDDEVTQCLQPFGLADQEIHTAWMVRRYVEQEKLRGFEHLTWADRRAAAEQNRETRRRKPAAQRRHKQRKALDKSYRRTDAYLHLTRAERMSVLESLVKTVGAWNEAQLFAEVVDKAFFSQQSGQHSPMMEFAFTALVERYERFLCERAKALQVEASGLIVQDNNPTVQKRLTNTMRELHKEGAKFQHVVETPLFVDSGLTRMVQIADLCAYATRRFFENQETQLFDHLYPRFGPVGTADSGIRHYADSSCQCRVCVKPASVSP
jgi:hypothetical protein